MTDFEDVRVLTLQKKSDGQKAMETRCSLLATNRRHSNFNWNFIFFLILWIKLIAHDFWFN